MLENLGFFHISSKYPVDADIANRKHYSAPAGAVTKFLDWFTWFFFRISKFLDELEVPKVIFRWGGKVTSSRPLFQATKKKKGPDFPLNPGCEK